MARTTTSFAATTSVAAMAVDDATEGSSPVMLELAMEVDEDSPSTSPSPSPFVMGVVSNLSTHNVPYRSVTNIMGGCQPFAGAGAGVGPFPRAVSSCDGTQNIFVGWFTTNPDPRHILGKANSGKKHKDPSQPDDSQASFREVDTLRAKELIQLTPKQREQLMDDIHGVATLSVPTPQEIVALFHKMQAIIEKTNQKRAYNLARLLSPSYVQDPKLLTMLLRAEQYDAPKAAVRLIHYFDCKLDLFGMDCLVRSLTLGDLEPHELESLKIGYMQVLPQRDRSGRKIVTLAQEHQRFRSLKSQSRVAWYTMMKAVENDDETQLNGMVGIMYNVGLTRPTQLFREQMLFHGAKLMRSLPMRYAAIHYCYDDVNLQPAMALFQMAFGTGIRLRFRAHFGSHVECLYALMPFGLPMSVFPIDPSGQLNTHWHLNIIERYRAQEERAAQELRMGPLITVPTSHDVLLGRGKSVQYFIGNQRLAVLVDHFRAGYLRADRAEKFRYAQTLLSYLQQRRGCRFLKFDDGRWQQVSHKMAHEKVSHTFRNPARVPTKSSAVFDGDDSISWDDPLLVGLSEK